MKRPQIKWGTKEPLGQLVSPFSFSMVFLGIINYDYIHIYIYIIILHIIQLYNCNLAQACWIRGASVMMPLMASISWSKGGKAPMTGVFRSESSWPGSCNLCPRKVLGGTVSQNCGCCYYMLGYVGMSITIMIIIIVIITSVLFWV